MASSMKPLNAGVLNDLLALGDRRLYSVYLDLSVGSNGQRSHEVFLKKKEKLPLYPLENNFLVHNRQPRAQQKLLQNCHHFLEVS